MEIMSSATEPRIYLDHAATSFPKAPGVMEALAHYVGQNGASAGRGAYREAFEAKKILEDCRSALASLLNISQPHRLVFTLNSTDALNLALKGILKAGDHVLTSCMEHNSVSRPLLNLSQHSGVTFTKVPLSLEGEIDWKEFEKSIRSNTKLFVFIHGSNVSGTLSPIAQIGERARRHGIPLLVDAAQTAGAFPIDVEAMKIDLLAMPGHKALLGPLGTGALWVREGIDLVTLKEGGTGSFSEEDQQPSSWPDIHESGSHNLLGLAGLKAACDYLKQKEIKKIRPHKINLIRQFYEGLGKISGLRVIAPCDPEKNAGVISLCFEGKNPQEVASQLDESYRIQVRPGLHCSPWAHQSLGTYPSGTVRFSLGYSNTAEEIEQALRNLQDFSKK